MNNTDHASLKYIIVVGASAGGFRAITELVSALPPGLPTAIFIVLHLSSSSSAGVIRDHLARCTNYECLIAADSAVIQPGRIYLAPPDFHLLIKKDIMRLVKGPHENRYRPSIDVLFRSAAAAYDSRVIGIVLSGMLDDGTSGMSAIKRSGGTCIVQEPADAAYPNMPSSVLNHVDVDYRTPVTEIGYILSDIFAREERTPVPIPEDVQLEAAITERLVSSISELEKLGDHSNYTCPDCGGGLWLMTADEVRRYRCHTGHVYTEHLLLEKQNEALEESLWVSIRMLEERRNLVLNLATQDQLEINALQQERAAELEVHIARLKDLMASLSKQKFPKDEGYL